MAIASAIPRTGDRLHLRRQGQRIVYDCFGDFEKFILDDCGCEIRFIVREHMMETLVRFARREPSRSKSWLASPTGDGRCRSSCAALRTWSARPQAIARGELDGRGRDGSRARRKPLATFPVPLKHGVSTNSPDDRATNPITEVSDAGRIQPQA